VRVSVVLPTFNRSRFLPDAFRAISSQVLTEWELIVIDDGSTDDTRAVVERLGAALPQTVRYQYQENGGAYAARNAGVDLASSEYVAFYDSDDIWLPQHLSACAAALDENPDVDWVYSSTEIVNLESGELLDRHCFYEDGQPRPFMRLAHDTRGALRVITDTAAIRCQIDYGLYCGLQNSVLRRRVFERLRFVAEPRNEAEDQVFPIRALAAGFRLAYFDAVHVRYHVHGENSTAASNDAGLQKLRRVYEPLIVGYRRLVDEVSLTGSERRALKRRIARELFWHLGYAGYWTAGDRRGAIDNYVQALRVWPWNPAQWKTLVLALCRHAPKITSRPSSEPKLGPG
jgi:glycosyltransferase involved in cell wall biosynthesis